MPRKSNTPKPHVAEAEEKLMKEFATIRAHTRSLKKLLQKQSNINRAVSRNLKKVENLITKFNQELLDAEFEIFQSSNQSETIPVFKTSQ